MDASNTYNPLYAILDAIPKEGILFDPKLMQFIVSEFAKTGHNIYNLHHLVNYLLWDTKLLEMYTINNNYYIRKTYG